MQVSYDVLILGGGIYGATAAYEAARRGLSVLLLERQDFGAGTSQNSLKIAHGGLRYLQSLDLRRSRESMEERRRLLQVAPHLVRPLRCRMESRDLGGARRLLLRAGLLANELLSRGRNRDLLPESRLPVAAFPCWYDALIEDTERLLLSFLDTAVSLGGERVVVRNYTTASDLVRESGRIVGARVPGLGEVRLGAVLDCTGVSRREQPAGVSMNLAVDTLPMSRDGDAVALMHPEDGRSLFVVPWRQRSLIGTYNRDYPHPPGEPLQLAVAWIDEFLDWIRPVHPDLAGLDRSHLRLVHAGLLPRVDDGNGELAGHYRIDEIDGIIRVLGVKYTTARGVSSEAVQLAARQLGREPIPDSPALLPRLRNHRDLLRRFVAAAPELEAPVHVAHPQLSRGAVVFAVEREQARSLTDVLIRRTGVAAAGHPGPGLVQAVASLLQQQLGWSAAECSAQVEAFDHDLAFRGVDIPDGAAVTS